MGFLDKLRDAGKSLAENAKEIKKTVVANSEEQKNAIYLDDFKKCGSIEGDSLPKTKNSLHFSIDIDNNELIIVERVTVTIKQRNKLIHKFSLDDIAEFRALKKERKNHSSFDSLTYISEIICLSGERYELSQCWFERNEDSRYNILGEWDGNLELNTVLMYFAPFVNDDYTKQWYNEIWAERGTGPAFDENGAIDLDAYLEMHRAWSETKVQEWNDRLNAVRD